MDAMGLPAIRPENAISALDERWLDSIAEHIANGKRPNQIAREVYPNDSRKRRQLRLRIWNRVWHDDKLHSRVAMRARGELVIALGPTVRALAGRAARGRPDAGKIILEASGFHNPRVRHDHTGEIKLTLNIPRPELGPQVVEGTAEDITGS